MKSLRAWLVLIISFACVAHAKQRAPDNLLTGFAKLEAYPEEEELLRRIDSASGFEVYEGLPHHLFESDAFLEQAARKDILWIHSVPFYRATLTVKKDDVRLVRDILADPNAHSAGTGLKMCGGFHPDYCIVWDSKPAVGVMVCLSCAEMMFYTKEGYHYRDIEEKKVFPALRAALEKYRASRPQKKEANQASQPTPVNRRG